MAVDGRTGNVYGTQTIVMMATMTEAVLVRVVRVVIVVVVIVAGTVVITMEQPVMVLEKT